MHPRIAQVLIEKPAVFQFLTKHRAVLQNMTPEGVKFLARNLRNSKDTLEEAAGDTHSSATGRTISLSNLSPEVVEQDVFSLIDDANLGPVEVSLPRESRRQRSCGVAFAVMQSQEMAQVAVRQLNGAFLKGSLVTVELLNGSLTNGWAQDARIEQDGTIDVDAIGEDAARTSRRISWKRDDELWDVALFDKNEPVKSLAERLGSSTGLAEAMVPMPAEAVARFHAAATRERAMERKMMQEAMDDGGPPPG